MPLTPEEEARYKELATGPIEDMTVDDIKELIVLMVKNGELIDRGNGTFSLAMMGGN
jgi:hypothetical protein